MHYPYLNFLKNVGLEVKLLQIRYTTSFNRRILVKINVFSKFLIRWFNVGVLMSLALLPLGIIILFMTLFNKSEGGGGGNVAADGSSYTNQRLELLIPGVNLPIEQIGFYFTALLISTFVHEIGHALAAIVEGVQVTGFGFQLYFIIPIAFTEISSEHMNSVNWLKQLRILCGGIWHNICLSFVCFMVLSFFGVLSGPFYEHNRGVVITDISPKSFLISSETSGLQTYDIIQTINDCKVQNVDDWRRCLKDSLKNASKLGYCVNQEYLSLNDQSTPIFYDDNGLVQCCEAKNTKATCFENHDSNQYNCLEIRKTIEFSSAYCYDKKCQEEEHCLHPILSNHSTIYSFLRRDNSLPSVIYIGHPLDVLRTVSVSEYIAKTNFFPSEFADTMLLFLKYNVIFSLGLAVINAVPCFGFDGYHITNTIVNRFFLHRIKERDKRNVIAFLITSFCTFLFVIAAVKIIWLSLLAKYFK